MSLKRILDEESGLTYTLEAILGVLFIIGAVIFATGNLPPTAQKTGEFSKVQLMNTGRDTIDLTSITPVFETSRGQPIETYILTADNYSVKPRDPVNFTIYYARNPSQKVMNKLNFKATVLFISAPSNISSNVSFQNDGTGHQLWIPPDGISTDDLKGRQNYEYSVQAYDSNSPPGMSNFSTIKVGEYDLNSYNTSFSGNGNVRGVVNYTYTNNPVPNLTIQILKATSNGPQTVTPNPDAALTDSQGYFSFNWTDIINSNSAGTYFIWAYNATAGNVSNMHVIESPGGQNNPNPALCASYAGFISCDIITVLEGTNVNLFMSNYGSFPNPGGWFYVNYIKDGPVTGTCANCSVINSDGIKAIFKAPIPGIYSIFICSTGCSNNIWNSAQKTNIILIYVLPVTANPIEDTCVNATELNTYMRNYTPPYVNYNLYLIGTNGSRFTRCPDFPTGQLINGYPTAEAVTVSKLFHIKYPPPPYIPIVDNITEFRMVLWYK